MSIKGIDSQIMVTRTAEYTKDVSAQIKKGELTQNHLSAQAAVHEASERIKVPTSHEAEEAKLHLNENGKNTSHEGEAKEKGAEKEEDAEVTSVNYVPPGNNIIDIKI